jgi:putative transposase
VSFHRRRLPHWCPEGVPIFLTWRLFGTLPRRPLERGQASSELTDGQRFAAQDRILDLANSGPRWLQQPEVAACVAETLLLGERAWKKYDLWAWVIMANHVHVLLTPHVAMSKVTRAIKSYSARKANEILGHTGESFWQDESYDHWVRKEEEMNRIIQYIEWNPVKASLVERVEDWPWSSASRQFRVWQAISLPHLNVESPAQ